MEIIDGDFNGLGVVKIFNIKCHKEIGEDK